VILDTSTLRGRKKRGKELIQKCENDNFLPFFRVTSSEGVFFSWGNLGQGSKRGKKIRPLSEIKERNNASPRFLREKRLLGKSEGKHGSLVRQKGDENSFYLSLLLEERGMSNLLR